MRRKVNLVGTNTLTVSLPAKWAAQNQIQKGDELNVAIGKKDITFSLGKPAAKEKEIILDISNFNKHLLLRYMEMFYITNYNRIVLTYSVPELYSDRESIHVNIKTLIKYISNRFIGMEIVAQTKNMTELHCFLLEEEKNLDRIEKRIFFLFKDTIEEFLLSLDKDHAEFHRNVLEHHDNIGKFINYYLRVLDQSDQSEEEKKQLYSLYMIIDKLLDKFRHVNDKIHQHGCNLRVKKMLKEIFELMNEQFAALHKGKIGREISTKRYELVKKIERTEYRLPELEVLSEARIFLDTLNDFSRAIIVKGLSRQE